MTTETTTGPNFEDLFQAVEFEEYQVQKDRVKVPVPDSVLKIFIKARQASERVFIPLKDDDKGPHLDKLRDVFASAGDTMGNSLISSLVMKDENGSYLPVKELKNATHVRVTVGQRRGQKAATGTPDAETSGATE